MMRKPRWAALVVAATLTAGLASAAVADDSLADKSSAELVSLLPDDVAPADWQAEKMDLHGKSAHDGTAPCDDILAGAGDRLRGMASLVAKPAGSREDFGFVVAYAKESGGYDAVHEFQLWVERCQNVKTASPESFERLSLTDGPDTAADPSVTAEFSAANLEGHSEVGLVTLSRIRGIIVMVISADEDLGTARGRLDGAVQATLAKLRAA